MLRLKADDGGTAMDEETRVQVCRLIAGIVVADDDLDDAEDAFLDRIMAKFEITDRDKIFPIIDGSEAAATMRHLPAGIQETALSLLVEAATADGKVMREERAYLHAVAEALGIPKDDMDRRIDDSLGARAS
jgi:uncharacterized tellurite resistance protein B-like protein